MLVCSNLRIATPANPVDVRLQIFQQLKHLAAHCRVERDKSRQIAVGLGQTLAEA